MYILYFYVHILVKNTHSQITKFSTNFVVIDVLMFISILVELQYFYLITFCIYLTFFIFIMYNILNIYKVVLELKSLEFILPVHEAQLVTYLKLADKRIGLLINFNVVLLKDGIRRRINGNPDLE